MGQKINPNGFLGAMRTVLASALAELICSAI